MGDVADQPTLFDHPPQRTTATPVRASAPTTVLCTCGKRVPLSKMRDHRLVFDCAAAPVDANRQPNVRLHAPDTSHAAAERALPRAATKRRIAYDLIRAAGEQGMTDDELEQRTGWAHQSASACRNSLMHDGWITDSGQRRPTRYGNDAICWVVAP